MDNLIQLVNRLQRACTVLGDYGGDQNGALPTLWEQLPSVAVVGGQSSGKSSVLESIVGKDFLPRGSGIVTRRPLVLQLHKTAANTQEYAEFLHQPGKNYTDFNAVRKEIADETDRVTGKSKQISPIPIHLSIHSPNVVNLTLVDLPGLTKIAVDGQPDSIVRDIETMVHSYVQKPNTIILGISPANQDIATSDAMKLSREVDPTGERTWGVLTKLDLMDKGTNALDVLEGRSYKLQHEWIGVVNRSQADINRNVDMMAARRREREYFATSPDYSHLASRMGTEYLAKMLSKHLEAVIKARIPSIQALINNNIEELETEMNQLGRPIGVDAGAQLYTVLEMCRAFDYIFKDHLDGGRPGGEKVYSVFDNKLPAALKKLPFDKHLSMQNVRRVVAEADGYQPHLIAPESGYRRLIEGALLMFKGPAEAVVDEVHVILRDLIRQSMVETKELQRFPTLQAELLSAATQALEKYREESRKYTIRLVEMETSYLTVEFFRRLPTMVDEKEQQQPKGNFLSNLMGADRYSDMHLKRIGSNVAAYVGMVMEGLRNSIPKSVVHCQVREAKRSLLDHFYATVGRAEGKDLAALLDEDPSVMARREAAFKRLDLLKTARDEIDSVAWANRASDLLPRFSSKDVAQLSSILADHTHSASSMRAFGRQVRRRRRAGVHARRHGRALTCERALRARRRRRGQRLWTWSGARAVPGQGLGFASSRDSRGRASGVLIGTPAEGSALELPHGPRGGRGNVVASASGMRRAGPLAAALLRRLSRSRQPLQGEPLGRSRAFGAPAGPLLARTSMPDGHAQQPRSRQPVATPRQFQGMELVFLGTSASIPTRSRNSSCVALCLAGTTFLFDCGEGVQRQMAQAPFRPRSIDRIFISHTHGDHLLSGLLCMISHTASSDRPPVEIYGPEGLRHWIRTTLKVAEASIRPKYSVHELILREDHGRRSWRAGRDEAVNLHRDELPGDDIPCSSDGLWDLYEDEQYVVRAGFLRHSIPCWGFVVSEQTRPGSLRAMPVPSSLALYVLQWLVVAFADHVSEKGCRVLEVIRFSIEKAQELRVPPGPAYAQLQKGHNIVLHNGRVVTPAQVLGSPRRGRRVVILGDTCDSSSLFAEGRGADVLVHEATLGESLASEASHRMHSTASMAGHFARLLEAEQLVLTHFSSRVEGALYSPNKQTEETVQDMVEAARASFQSKAVVAARDYMVVPVHLRDAMPLDHRASGPVEGAEKKRGKKAGKAKEPKAKAVAFYRLFAFADSLDILLMVVGSIGAAAHGAALPVFFLFFGKIINSFGTLSDNRVSNQVDTYVLDFLYLGLVVWIGGWVEVAAWMQTGERQAARIRSKYLEAMLKQEVGYFDTEGNSGEIVTRVSSDVLLVGNYLHFMATFVTGFVVGFTLIWKLTLVILAVVPIIAVAGGTYAVVLTGLTSKGQEAYVQAGGVAEQAVAQVRTVYSFTGESRTLRAYAAALERPLKLGIQGGLAKGLGLGFTFGTMFCIWALVFWYAGELVADPSENVNGGKALSTMFSVIIGGISLGQAAPNYTAFGEGKAAAYKIFEMINRKPAIDAEKEGKTLPKVRGDIELRDVCFSYPSRPDVQIFRNFNLTVPAGKTVALVGTSGSGKSTVVSLIERFYDPASGSVFIDGVDTKEMQLKWLRQQVGLVSQEPALFATSIKENILYGKADATMEDVERAARAANCHSFISQLPNAYDTQVGERGVQLSGGQKQRVAIARAVLKDPSILLLDEATSALDTESERVVQDALDKLMVGRTTVVIAHRLSTIQNADAIAVVSQGAIVELGRHQDLIDREGGAYASLVRLQQMSKDGGDESQRALGSSGRESGSRRISLQMSNLSDSPSEGGAVASKGAEATDKSGAADAARPVGRKSNMWRLLQLCRPDTPSAIVGSVGAIMSGCVNPVFGLVLLSVVTAYYDVDKRHMKDTVAHWCFVFIGMAVFAVVGNLLLHYNFGKMGERLTKRVRELMFAAILTRQVGWFDKDENSSGAVASRLASDATLVKAAAGDRLALLLQNAALVIVAFTIALILRWQMALVVIATFPVLIASAAVQQAFLKGFAGDQVKSHAQASMVAAEAVSNIRTVAAFSAESKVLALFESHLVGPLRRTFVRGQVAGFGFGFSQFCMYTSFGLGLWYGGTLVRDGDATFKEVLKVFIVLIMTSFAIAETLTLAPDLAKGGRAVDSFYEVLDYRTEIEPDDPSGKKLDKVRGKIELRDVEFRYPARPDVPVFSSFSLTVPAGKTVALVGASGSGKSTVLSLVERFYDPLGGAVLVDGHDIRTLNLRWLRTHIALVAQEPALFSTTIRENIMYGKDNATEAEIVEAARAANAHSFISTLPDGYNTEVGDRGVQLSGGQKQRVAIARAILKTPSILLLDEATSALDAESERVVQEALDRLLGLGGRTTVVVAHRLSTIRNADVIAVVEKGQVVEQGRHADLVRQPNGAYRSLINFQQSTGGAPL
eukprot:SM000009S23514  [mRNA]  locus=s9:452194:477102:- [translate_table: standard]